MSDLALGGPQATDLFSLGGNYHAQNSSAAHNSQVGYTRNANGDAIANSGTYGGKTSATVPYKYSSTSPMYSTSTSAHRTLPRPGQVKGGYKIDRVQVAYTNSDDLRPTVTVTGHKHDTNSHSTTNAAQFSPTITIPGGVGVPSTIVSFTGTAGMIGASYEIACEHVDQPGGDGNQLAGASYDGKESLDVQFTGTPIVTTPTSWIRTDSQADDSNTAFDMTPFKFERHIARD